MKTKNNPKVSIIVPCYNCEKYIANCLDSLLKQDYKDFEVVIINDGSKDNSQKIIEKYMKKDKRIKLINQENGGVWKARICGLKNASGEYIGFIDADDDVLENYLSSLMNSIKKNKSDIAVCGYKRIDNETKKVLATEMTNWKHEVYDIKDNLLIIPSINTSNWNKIYKKSLFIDYEKLELNSKTFEDMALNIIAYLNTKKISFVNSALYNYYVNPTSIMNNLKEKDVESFKTTMKNIRKFVEERNEKFLDVIDLMAVIHLEFSIAHRLYSTNSKNRSEIIKDLRNYIKTNFPKWKSNPYIKIRYQFKHSFLNIKIIILYYVFKFNLINLFLKLYSFVINVFKIDIKW